MLWVAYSYEFKESRIRAQHHCFCLSRLSLDISDDLVHLRREELHRNLWAVEPVPVCGCNGHVWASGRL